MAITPSSEITCDPDPVLQPTMEEAWEDAVLYTGDGVDEAETRESLPPNAAVPTRPHWVCWYLDGRLPYIVQHAANS
jgi:hypothetical protein